MDASELLQKKGVQGIIEAWEEADKNRIDPFPPLIEEIDGIVEGFLQLKERAVPIPKEFDFLRTYRSTNFLPDGLVPALYALAGVPEAGKTTILNQLADALAKDGIPSVYFHTEESKYRLLSRTVRKEGAVGIRELVNIAPAILKNRRIFEMTPEYTAEKLADILQGIMLRLRKQGKDKLVFIIDSLHAMRSNKEAERGDIREKAILKIEMLSHIARDLQIPVIFTSFMPRSSYKEEPTVAIFKESGDIEYLVDVAMCLWNGNGNEIEEWQEEPALTLSFVKNRFGRSGIKANVELKLNRKKCKFELND
jgi:replicative DNA helicase